MYGIATGSSVQMTAYDDVEAVNDTHTHLVNRGSSNGSFSSHSSGSLDKKWAFTGEEGEKGDGESQDAVNSVYGTFSDSHSVIDVEVVENGHMGAGQSSDYRAAFNIFCTVVGAGLVCSLFCVSSCNFLVVQSPIV